jgi:E3 ubiquitin-protein ligase TRIP12
VFAESEQRQRALQNLKTQSGAKVEDLSLSFILPGFDDIELKPDGKNLDVNLDNLQEYLELSMHYLFHESIKI